MNPPGPDKSQVADAPAGNPEDDSVTLPVTGAYATATGTGVTEAESVSVGGVAVPLYSSPESNSPGVTVYVPGTRLPMSLDVLTVRDIPVPVNVTNAIAPAGTPVMLTDTTADMTL